MVETLVTIRDADASDAENIAAVHDAAWREAYRGIIPGRELEKMIARRGPDWWRAAIRRGSRIAVLEFDESVEGYVSYGRNRAPDLPFSGEIYEIYLMPDHQGLGFGRRLFSAARFDLAEHGYANALVWALTDNERAIGFYERLGGRVLRKSHEKFAGEVRSKVAFGFS